MSQPPQPPDRPPAGGTPESPGGGFGPPQDPSYGDPPQQPPGRPGQTDQSGGASYGYPQTPPSPAAPAQGGGFGPPAPSAYGYPGPQQPYGQQPYGMYPPPAPFPGSGLPPQPGGGQSKQRMLVVVSAVVTVLLVVAGGVWLATSGGDGKQNGVENSADGSNRGGGSGDGAGKPETVDGELIAKIPKPKVEDQVTTEGLWVTGEVFAKGGVDKIVGYDPTGRRKKWEIPLPGSICWSSRQMTEDGRTAVLFQGAKATKDKPHQGCTEVAAIDINSGRKLWQKNVRDGDEKVRFDEVTVGGGTVAAGGTRGGAAWRLDDGKQLWKPEPNEECQDDGYGGGTKLVAVRRCGDYSKPTLEVQTLNPATGAPKSVFRIPSGIEYAHIASTDPLVVAVDAGDNTGSGASDFMAVDDSGKAGRLRGKVATQQGQYRPRCKPTDVEGCKLLAVSKDTLYLPTEEHQGQAEYGRTNEIVGFRLDGGKSTGKADAGERRTMVPLRMDGDRVIAYRYPTYDKGGQVLSIDPETYKATVVLDNPKSTADTEGNFRPEFTMDVVFAGSRLYMGQQYVTDREPVGGGEDYLAVVFGAE